MDVRSLLDSLMNAGRTATEHATDFAERNLGLPTDPDTQRDVLKTLGAGAALGGIATMILGTKTGRKIAGRVAAVGTLAAVGTVAYQAYEAWASKKGVAADASKDLPMATLVGEDADKRSLTILRAMVAAAHADGEIDMAESLAIDEQMEKLQLPSDSRQWLRKELQSPRNAWNVASLADSPAAAAEIYTVSRIIVDQENPAEQAYLEELRAALQLDSGFVSALEQQINS